MLISSKMTFFYKRVFPILWLGFLGLFVLIGLASISASPNKQIILPFLIAPVAMAIIGYLLFKFLLFDLVDEVIDDGDYLTISNGPQSERIALTNILNVNASVLLNPPRITLLLRKPCSFGDKISFMPPIIFGFRAAFRMHPLAEELIRRIDRLRHRD